MVTLTLAFEVSYWDGRMGGKGKWREPVGRNMVTAVLASVFSELLRTVVPFRTTQQVQKDPT